MEGQGRVSEFDIFSLLSMSAILFGYFDPCARIAGILATHTGLELYFSLLLLSVSSAPLVYVRSVLSCGLLRNCTAMRSSLVSFYKYKSRYINIKGFCLVV